MANITSHIARHLRELYVGRNWTWVDLKGSIEGLTWQQAITSVHGLNSIALLIFHMNFYVEAQISVLKGGLLLSKDKDAFKLPPITSDADWQVLLSKTYADAEELASLIEQMPEEKLWDTFVDERYGTYYRNLHGNIEHLHYHLGQIVLIRKILQQG
jgi:hypothetical protein